VSKSLADGRTLGFVTSRSSYDSIFRIGIHFSLNSTFTLAKYSDGLVWTWVTYTCVWLSKLIKASCGKLLLFVNLS